MLRISRLTLAALVLTLVTVVSLNSTQALAASPALAPPELAVATGTSCPQQPDGSLYPDQRAVAHTVACVAEQMRSTRGALQEDCLTGAKALNGHNPWYDRIECHGGNGVQVEAIAQARSIARLNVGEGGAFGPVEVGPGITENVQWEVRYPGNRIDVLGYNRNVATAPIELIELKQKQYGGEAAAETQLIRYGRGLPPGSNNRLVIRHLFAGGYLDYFRVLVKDCINNADRNRVLNQYKVSSTDSAGVLLITTMAQEVTPCPEPNAPRLRAIPDEEPVPEPVAEPVPVYIYPAVGRDSNHDGQDDFKVKFLEEHPELNDIPSWPALPAVPVPDTQTVVVTAAVLLVLVAIVALAGTACAATAPVCATGIGIGTATSAIGTATAATAGEFTLAASLNGLLVLALAGTQWTV